MTEEAAGLIARLRTVQTQLAKLEREISAWEDSDQPASQLVAKLRRHGLIRN